MRQDILHEIERPKPEGRAIVPVSEDDLRRILEAMMYTKEYARTSKKASRHRLKNADRNRAIIMLLLDTGIRATELCTLRINDVDLRNRHMKVFGKGAKERELPFSARTGEAIWRYISKRRDDRVTSPLFNNDSGGPMDRIDLLHLLERAGKWAEVVGAHAHRFRHPVFVMLWEIDRP